MIDSLIVSLILAFISGITFLAYKHPDTFSKIYLALTVLSAVVFFSIVFYNAGLLEGRSIIGSSSLTKEQKDIFISLIKNKEISYTYSILIFFGFHIYLQFLLWLPNLLEKEKNKIVKEEKNKYE